jgi:hypothetical protein
MRLKKLVLTGLVHDRLLVYDKLQNLVNDDELEMEFKEKKIRELLKQAIQYNAMISEWETLMTTDSPTNINDLQQILGGVTKTEKDG